MSVNRQLLSSADTLFALTLVTELIALWRAGKEVVLDRNGVSVDGKEWPYIPSGSAAVTTNDVYTFKSQNGKWTIATDASKSQFKDSVGLRYTHLLLPEKPIDPIKMIWLVNNPGAGLGPNKPKVYDFEEGGCFEGLNVQNDTKDPLLTPESKTKIYKKLTELEGEAKLLRDAGDDERAMAMEQEIEKISEHLGKAVGKGRDRTFANRYKGALDSVRIAIKRAIRSIGTVNPKWSGI